MTTATEKPSWSTSGEALLNVPQSERSDDDGEPSEVKSSDAPSLAGRPLEQPGTSAVQNQGQPSTASPEAPLVSTESQVQRETDEKPQKKAGL